MPDGSAQNIATGVAGGLIVIALIETLLDKNVIALAEARHVLQRAVNSLSPARTRSPQNPRRNAARLLFGAVLTRTHGDRGAVLNILAALIP